MEPRQCERCLLRLIDRSACVAFPNGIPADIFDGWFDHTQPYPDDGGFRFFPHKPPRAPEEAFGSSTEGSGSSPD